VHQKCSNYTLTNLLFGLCRSVWIIDLLVIHPCPHRRAPTRPSTSEVLQARECAPTPYPSIIFTFRLAIESIEAFGGASPSMCISLKHKMKSCYIIGHVVARFIASKWANQLVVLHKIFGKYWSLWRLVFSPLVTHTLVSCWMCDNGSSPSWYLGNYIFNTLPTIRAMATNGTTSVELNYLCTLVYTLTSATISLPFSSEISKLPIDLVNLAMWLYALYYSLPTFPSWGTPSWKWLNVLACLWWTRFICWVPRLIP
jgi:hypothetical protein